MEKQTSPQTNTKGQVKGDDKGNLCAWLEGAAPAADRETGRCPRAGISELRPETKGGDGSIQAREPLGIDQQQPTEDPVGQTLL